MNRLEWGSQLLKVLEHSPCKRVILSTRDDLLDQTEICYEGLVVSLEVRENICK